MHPGSRLGSAPGSDSAGSADPYSVVGDSADLGSGGFVDPYFAADSAVPGFADCDFG